MSNNGYISIPEAAVISNKTEACIYRHLRKGSIHFQKVSEHGRTVKKVRRSDVIDFFNISFQKVSENSQKHTDSSETITETFQKLTETLKEELNLLRQDNITALAPINQNVSFLVRTIQAENKSLFQKVSEQEETIKSQAGDLEGARKENSDLLATIEELKRRLEAEEKRPWYKKLL
ncbi:MAG: hypothetical protein AB1478_10775 [Nitrospirota bacterium]